MTEALVTPSVLAWARHRSGLDTAQLANRLNVKPEAIGAWEEAERKPTFRQAQRLAQTLNVPFGFLFLSGPPEQKLPIPDRRNFFGQEPPQPSPALVDVLSDAMTKQQWYREYREAEGAVEPPSIGRFSVTDSAKAVSDHIRDAIDLDGAVRQAFTLKSFLSELSRSLEDSGVIVMRSGVVRNNPHRPLDADEFRGFVVNDDIAPLIFINDRDFSSAQTFTLAHETALIWVGESGLSNPDYRSVFQEQNDYVAQFCNQVAADMFAPLGNRIHGRSEDNQASDHIQQAVVAADSPISVRFAAQLSNLNLILDDRYWDGQVQFNQASREGKTSGGHGAAYYNVLIARNGTLLTEAVVSSLLEGTLLYREAADLLNVRPKTVLKIVEHLSADRRSFG